MQAVTITVDQRGAVRGERLFDQKKRREEKKLMVTKVEIRMCRGCDSLVSLQRERAREKKDLRNAPTPVTGSRYPLH